MNIKQPSAELTLFLSKLPGDPGIYRMLDEAGTVLYVGKASNLKKRVSSYFSKQNTAVKTRSLVSQIASIEISVTRSETEALLLESNLIKSLRPKYNILLRDDKSYPYIHISSHPEFPRIESYRSKKKPVSGLFFGPYPNGTAVKDTILTIQKVFKIRNCRDSYFNARSRPCLQYQIKRCTAPCVAYISPEAYRQSVDDAMRFLQGKCQIILDELTERMEQAVDQLNFEAAAVFRDQIKNLRLVQEQQAVVQLKGDADVIAIEVRPGFACIQCVTIREGQVLASRSFFPSVPNKGLNEELDAEELWQQTFEAFVGFYYLDSVDRIPALIITNKTLLDHHSLEEVLTDKRGKSCTIQINPRGIKSRWMDFAVNNLRISIAEYVSQHSTIKSRYQALEKLLSLEKHIERMECFDISHTQGEATIASCVVFDEEGPCTKEYRRFNIEGITPGDDYAAMEQAVTRRFKRLIEAQSLPDVLIIDGGKGQVAVVKRVLESLKVHDMILLGVAKGPSRKAGWEKLILVNEDREFTLPEDSKALHLLQHIRDEAHRFAITAHRKKRQKARLDSTLESIEGVGAKRRQALLHRFGGLRELSKASIEEISKVQGISEHLAMRIYQYFHG
ncbi:excinuclease ABC subunit UvrC [Legionella bononiensis]|uniref:UvrABC system protein C n=1 Tax=Legionella bononiensis TaxID=2793102 RepID=A0ABS1WA86_9GAMM|nr:excinuclease ABC subunit UvrC [Legionella bononiensis]MBL7480485.1 excinuclease ABC subunit UvrC [Legionella bononiensis]MBL7526276.1 excinuclease ABC subunit UvrC [Legionella bononiensis]MBL7563229.1 excinuclease ABC subunit UvrC [Legionella bononiensis]